MSRSVAPSPRHHVVATRLDRTLFSRVTQHARLLDISLSAAILSLIERHYSSPAAPAPRASVALSIKPHLLAAIDEHGRHLNAIARAINALDAPPPGDLAPLIDALSRITSGITAMTPPADNIIVLAPPSYHSLNHITVNLRQIEERLHLTGFPPPAALPILRASLCHFLNRAHQAPAS